MPLIANQAYECLNFLLFLGSGDLRYLANASFHWLALPPSSSSSAEVSSEDSSSEGVSTVTPAALCSCILFTRFLRPSLETAPELLLKVPLGCLLL